MSKLEEIKRAYGYGYRLSVDTYPYWLISRVEELGQENKQIKVAYQDRCDDLEGLLEHFGTSWEEMIDD